MFIQRGFFFDSRTADNSTDKGNVSFSLIEPILVPANAENVEIKTNLVVFENLIINIVQGQNTLTFTLRTVGEDDISGIIIIPEGAYNLEQLNEVIVDSWNHLQGGAVPSSYETTAFLFELNPATGKVFVHLTNSSMTNTTFDNIEFSADVVLNDLLGFGPTVILSKDQPHLDAQNKTSLNTASTILISCDTLCSNGIPINGYNSGVIAVVPVPPESQGTTVTYRPNEPIATSGNHLIDNMVSNVTFRLLGPDRTPLVFRGEWSILISIMFSLK